MLQDHLSGRQNVVHTEVGELNKKLDAVAQLFGLEWLQKEGSHPLQLVWRRMDALATSELLNFGDAIEQLLRESPKWLEGQVDIIKSGDIGNVQGAIFEILALNLFSRQFCKVIPATKDLPGFDGTLVLSDGARVLVSLKNHGLSSYEREFRNSAKDFDGHFQQALTNRGLCDTEIRVLAPKPMTSKLWEQLKQDTDLCLDRFASGQSGGAIKGPYQIVLKPIDASYHPTSKFFLSSSCLILAPHHVNEQKKFVEDVRKGCANLLKHTESIEGDICRLILLRLSATASLSECREWAQWYFNEYPSDPLDVILLYQTVPVGNNLSDTTGIAHYFAPVVGPSFTKWQTNASEHPRRLPSMSVLVGSIAVDQAGLILANGTGSLDISRYYAYQRADIYRKLDISCGATEGLLSNPAPGVMIHLVLEQHGELVRCLSMITERDKALTLLP
jgi:hypothetical protein